MRRFNAWQLVQVKDEEHEQHGRAGKVGNVDARDADDQPLYAENEVPVLLDGDSDELVFQADELKAL